MGVASAHTSFGSELNENCNCLQGMGHTQHCKGGRCGWREGKFPFTVVNCVVVLCAMSVCEQASTQKILIHGPLVCQQGGEMQKSINLPATASIVQLSSSVRHPLPCHWLLCYWYYKVIVLESRCHHTLCQGLLLSSASELPWLHFFLQQFPMSWSMLNLFLSRLTESQNSPGWNKPQKTIKSNLLWVKGAQMRLTSVLFNCILKTSTISLGRVSQWWVVLTIKMSFLYQNETQFAPIAPSLLHVAPYEERASVPIATISVLQYSDEVSPKVFSSAGWKDQLCQSFLRGQLLQSYDHPCGPLQSFCIIFELWEPRLDAVLSMWSNKYWN